MTRTLEELREYLVGEWLFQNDFRDTSGNDNHGVPIDVEWKPTERGMKPYGGKISFGNFNPTNVFTAVIWVKADVWDDNYNSIFALSDEYGGWPSSSNEAWCIMNYYSSDDIRFAVGDDTKYNAFDIFNDNRPVGNWLMIGVSCNLIEGWGKTFVNGKRVDYDSTTFSEISQASMELFVGYYSKHYYDCPMYFENIALNEYEHQLLYNSTKHAYGVTPAERSFSHDVGSVLGTDENTVFATDMHTKNADGTLIDLSGNSNHGTINGAVRSSGYFRDWMRFNGGSDNISTVENDILHIGRNDFTIELLMKYNVIDDTDTIIYSGATSSVNNPGVWIRTSGNDFFISLCPDIGTRISDTIYAGLELNKLYHVIFRFNRSGACDCFFDGIQLEDKIDISSLVNENIQDFVPLRIGRYNDTWAFDGEMNYMLYSHVLLEDTECESRFNSLANLPIYTFDFSKYPSNITVYDDFLPYSSARISSGSFKVNDDKLECVTDGQIVFRNAHEFDGDEYIKLTINDTVYSGTGTITQGTTTASIEQGSTLITVDMVAGDTIDSIDIQFREPVDE